MATNFFFFFKSADDFAHCTIDQKFSQNSHRFRDKFVLAFYTEIEDGHQKLPRKDVLKSVHMIVTVPGPSYNPQKHTPLPKHILVT